MNESSTFRRLLRGVLVLAVALSFTPFSSASAAPSRPGGSLPKSARKPDKPKAPKLDSSLSKLTATAEAKGKNAARAFGTKRGLKTDGNHVTIVVESAPGDVEAAKKHVTSKGGRVEAAYEGLMSVSIPVSELESLAGEESVLRVRPPRKFVAEQISEGAAETNASALGDLGYNGSGVKIGIIDLGFAGLDEKLGSELPATVVRFGETEGSGDEGHGTAVAEIVHDMAPGAELYLAQLTSEVDLGLAIDWMIGQGVKVINMSLVIPGGGAGDGSGVVNEIISDAVSRGVFWANAAGNHRMHHWSGNFVDVNANTFNDFGPGEEVQYFGAMAGQPLTAALVWDDSWTAATQDYDLYLFQWNGAQWVDIDWSENVQNGTSGQTPEEVLETVAPEDGVYAWAIKRYSATRTDVDFDLFDVGQPLVHKVVARSLTVPADNASDGFMAVGAVGRSPGFAQEDYSSEGPTRDGRVAPELVAPSSVTNSVYGTFAGTSASSPHLAGAAALLKQANPSSGPAALEQSLESSAMDLGAPGPDSKYGHGRLWLPGFPESLGSSPVTGTVNEWATTVEHHLALNKGDDLTLSLARLSGAAPVKATLLTPSGAVMGSTVEGSTMKRTASATGLHRILVSKSNVDTETAEYRLSWTRVKATGMTVAPSPANPGYGKPSVIKATLKDTGGAGVAGSVTFQRSYDRQSWSDYKTISTSGSTGVASFSYTPKKRTYFRALYKGQANRYKPALTTETTINPLAYLTIPKAPRSVKRKTTFSVSGYLRPKHKTGTKHVKIRCYRYEKGKWVLRETYSAKVSRYNSTTARYAGKVTLPYAGKWRIRARVAGDSVHATTYSSYRKISVNPTKLSISSNRSTTTYGISAKIMGVLKDMSGRPIAGKSVVFEKSTDGKTWKKIKTLTTSSKGVVAKSVRPDKKAYYRFRFLGDRAQKASTSDSKRIRPRNIVLTGDGSADRRVYLKAGEALVYWAYTGDRFSLSVKHENSNTTVLKWSRGSAAGENVFYSTPKLARSGYYQIRVRTDEKWGVGIR